MIVDWGPGEGEGKEEINPHAPRGGWDGGGRWEGTKPCIISHKRLGIGSSSVLIPPAPPPSIYGGHVIALKKKDLSYDKRGDTILVITSLILKRYSGPWRIPSFD